MRSGERLLISGLQQDAWYEAEELNPAEPGVNRVHMPICQPRKFGGQPGNRTPNASVQAKQYPFYLVAQNSGGSFVKHRHALIYIATHKIGSGCWVRTNCLTVIDRALIQMSLTRIEMVERVGIEPTMVQRTVWVTAR